MLVLTRKTDDEIKINSEITIKVLSISEGHVKLGISAPDNVEIYRGEIYDKIKKATIEASKSSKLKPKDLSSLLVNKIRKMKNEK
ncbi:MAG TPA: carbon storage regulator [Ignavibacteria bacterium]|nr:carbon storage regulator [Ignavibacteria bacterium]